MSGYIEASNLMCEITESISHPGSSSELEIVPPVLEGNKPFILIIASAGSDFEVQVGGGDFMDVVAADLGTDEQFVLSRGDGDRVIFKSSSSNTIIVRWLFKHPRSEDYQSLSVETFEFTQNTTESTIKPPPGSVEMTITDLSGDMTYRYDNYITDGGLITLDNTKISKTYPYNIPAFVGNRLRMDSTSGTVTVSGYWIIGKRF